MKRGIAIALVFLLMIPFGGCGSLPARTEHPYYAAYLDILYDNKWLIDNYDWQRDSRRSSRQTDENIARPVAIADIYGDETPELVYLSGNSYTESDVASLHIVTYENGQTKTIFYKEYWDSLVAGGFYYYLYQVQGDKTLYAYESTGDDYWTYTYASFETANHELTLSEQYKHDRHPSADHTDTIHTYTKNRDETISERDYNEAIAAIESKTAAVIMYSVGCNDFLNNYVAAHGCSAMTCDEAIRYLRNRVGAADTRTQGWQTAYRTFILHGEFLQSNQYKFFPGYETFSSGSFTTDIDTIYIGLWDISGDGVPELFMSNESASEAESANYVFTVANGKVEYVGKAGGRHSWLRVDTARRYNGVFTFSGAWGVYTCEYVTLQNGRVMNEPVFMMVSEFSLNDYAAEIDEYGQSETYGKIGYVKETSDSALYARAKEAVAPETTFSSNRPNPAILEHFSIKEIREMGWKQFIAHVVKTIGG